MGKGTKGEGDPGGYLPKGMGRVKERALGLVKSQRSATVFSGAFRSLGVLFAVYNLCTESHAECRHSSILQMEILRFKRTKPSQLLSSAPESCSQSCLGALGLYGLNLTEEDRGLHWAGE